MKITKKCRSKCLMPKLRDYCIKQLKLFLAVIQHPRYVASKLTNDFKILCNRFLTLANPRILITWLIKSPMVLFPGLCGSRNFTRDVNKITRHIYSTAPKYFTFKCWSKANTCNIINISITFQTSSGFHFLRFFKTKYN